MIKIVRYLGVAFESIFSNKLRAALAMLGIIIGIASVVSMVALGEGRTYPLTVSRSTVVNSITLSIELSSPSAYL